MRPKEFEIARKCAQAFYLLHANQIDQQVFWQLRKAADLLRRRASCLIYLDLATPAEFISMSDLLQKSLSLSVDVRPLIKLLQRQQRLSWLSVILANIAEIYLQESQQAFFIIESYPSLSAAQAGVVVHFLENQLKCSVLSERRENQNLMAGLRCQSSNWLYDDTVRGRLQICHRKLLR